VPKKYKKLEDFFSEPSIEKSKNILLLYNKYFQLEDYLNTKKRKIY
jgi:hypothetical protein